ncbi:hypothetical protein ACIBKX_07880 [Streptomyces sp. NPDC050658]|uniref:hypothetical protein n=1 Tax=unclassified Streptomyces TaxID=2593676 RepID=UPI003445C416
MRIDLNAAVTTARELLEALEELNDAEPDEAPTRAARRRRAEITRELLYLSHLGNRVSVEVMDAYHEFKMRDDPVGE